MNSDLKIVIGLGKTGLSCVRYLAKQNYNLAVVDNKFDPPGLKEIQSEYPTIPLHLGVFNEVILSQAQELIISPGVSLAEPVIAKCIKKGVKVTGDIELFTQATKTPIIAITGSNGKTTVTALVGEMIKDSGLKVGVGGNFGLPALDLLEQPADLYVLELSSFQLETTQSLEAKASVILNISTDHMDRYKNLDEYTKAKQKIYANCNTAIINRDDPLTYHGVSLPNNIISFGTDKPSTNNFGIDNNHLMYGNEKILPIASLKIKGLHNISNALAALALGKAIGLPIAIMINTLKNFSGLHHRSEWVAKISNVNWYNDSKGTNVGATKAAIEGLGAGIDGKIILIAGGIGKGADFTPLCDSVEKYTRTVVLIGKDAPIIEDALKKSSKIIHASSMNNAVTIAAKEALPNDVVLLSPACASFDMFKDFEHRGKIFINEVKKLDSN